MLFPRKRSGTSYRELGLGCGVAGRPPEENPGGAGVVVA